MLKKVFSAKFFLLLILLYLAWQFIVMLRPRPVLWNVLELAAIQQAVEQCLTELEVTIPLQSRIKVARLRHDPNGQASQILREAIVRRESWCVYQGSLIRKFLSDVFRVVVEATSLDEILHSGRHVELDILVLGKVLDVRSERIEDVPPVSRASAILQLQVFSLQQGRELFNGKISAIKETGAPATRKRGAWHPVFKFGIWMLFVLLLPWIGRPLLGWVLEKKSNWISLLLLGTYSTLDLLAAFFLLNLRVCGWVQSLTVVLLLLCSMAYNTVVCESIGKRWLSS